ncbi:MAG: hypothetical protein R3B09_15880 [Nannocystaceae bacterium]
MVVVDVADALVELIPSVLVVDVVDASVVEVALVLAVPAVMQAELVNAQATATRIPGAGRRGLEMDGRVT